MQLCPQRTVTGLLAPNVTVGNTGKSADRRRHQQEVLAWMTCGFCTVRAILMGYAKVLTVSDNHRHPLYLDC